MPDRRSPEEIKRSFELAKKMAQRNKKKENESSVRYATNALLVLAIIQALVAAYFYSVAPLLLNDILIEIAIGGVFLGLFFYAKKEPVIAFTIALAIYGTITLIVFALQPGSMLFGILIKGVIIAVLVTGLTAAKKLPKPKTELQDDLVDDDLDL